MGRRISKYNMFTVAVLAWIVIIALVLIIFNGIELMWRIKEYRYYSNEENFMEVTAEIDYIAWNHSEQIVYLGVSEIPEIFSDETFDIDEENFQRILDNGGEEQL